MRKLLLEIEKNESKKVKISKITRVNEPESIRAGRARAIQIKKMYLPEKTDQLYLKILV